MLTGFFASLFALLRWLTISAVPFMLSAFVVGLFVKLGLAVGSMAVIVYAANTLKDMALSQLSTIAAGSAGAAVLELLALFGVFEGISLIVSSMLAKASWMAVRPSLTWLTPPGGGQ